jgi:hypothetical protein
MHFLATLLTILLSLAHLASACLTFQASWNRLDSGDNLFRAYMYDNSELVCDIVWTPFTTDYMWFSCYGVDHAAWMSRDLLTLAYHAHGDNFRFYDLHLTDLGDGLWKWHGEWFCDWD